jgi:hypothetical protein
VSKRLDIFRTYFSKRSRIMSPADKLSTSFMSPTGSWSRILTLRRTLLLQESERKLLSGSV